MTRRRTTWRFAHVLLAMLAVGCAKRAGPDRTAAPNYDAAGDAPGDDLAALEQQLDAREGQLRSAGVGLPNHQALKKEAAQERVEDATAPEPATAPPRPTTAPVAAGADSEGTPAKPEAPGGRCMSVCEISASICSLQDHICGLLPRHRDDPRYQAACDRAAADCQISTEACHGCSDA